MAEDLRTEDLHTVTVVTSPDGHIRGVRLDGADVICLADEPITVRAGASDSCMVVTLPLICRAFTTEVTP